jgi:hypothetical protein
VERGGKSERESKENRGKERKAKRERQRGE